MEGISEQISERSELFAENSPEMSVAKGILGELQGISQQFAENSKNS